MLLELKKRLKAALFLDRDPWMSDARWHALYAEHYTPKALAQRRFYNIGAGAFAHPYWTNIDKKSHWYGPQHKQASGHIEYDLFSLAPLPINPAGQAEVIYISHVLEHIHDEAAAHLLGQARCHLKAGGVLRIVSPNVDLAWRALKAADRSFFYWQHEYSKPHSMKRSSYGIALNEASLEQLFITFIASSASHTHSDGIDTPMTDRQLHELMDASAYEAMLDAICHRCDIAIQKRYPGNHINWWNPQKARAFLQKAGFEQITPSAYGQSACAVLRDTRLFDKTHPKMSFYIEARG